MEKHRKKKLQLRTESTIMISNKSKINLLNSNTKSILNIDDINENSKVLNILLIIISKCIKKL